jgi:hypothetical protein
MGKDRGAGNWNHSQLPLLHEKAVEARQEKREKIMRDYIIVRTWNSWAGYARVTTREAHVSPTAARDNHIHDALILEKVNYGLPTSITVHAAR